MPHPPREPGDHDPRLVAALALPLSFAATAETCAALVDAHVLAAVAATATGHERAEATGLPAESGAELAVLLIEAADGSRALPVFTDAQQLRRWRLEARPVPLTGMQACAAALEQGAEQLVIDPAGAARVLDRSDLVAVAAGWVPVVGSGLRSKTGQTVLAEPSTRVDPDLLDALQEALRPERLVAGRLLEGPDGLVVGVTSRRRLGPADLTALADRVMARLGPRLPEAGLGLAEVAAAGPGLVLVRPRRLRRR